MKGIKFSCIVLVALLSGCEFLPQSIQAKKFDNAYECMASRVELEDPSMLVTINYLLDYIKYCYQFAENGAQEDWLIKQATGLFTLKENIKKYNSQVPRVNQTMKSVGFEGEIKPIN